MREPRPVKSGGALRRALLLTAAGLALILLGRSSRHERNAVDWVPIPGGSFMMGSDAETDARPVHRVELAPFELSRTQVTFGQYRECVAAGACAAVEPCLPVVPMGDDQPVVCVSWFDAQNFARWAGGRLPSEAEWDYAAHGAGLGVPACERSAVVCQRVDGASCDRPVCSHPEINTPQGLCDMAGDDWEWVADWYHASYAGAPADGSAWTSPSSPTRVSRLGSWDRCLGDLGAASRDDDPPQYLHAMLGFRVARSVPSRRSSPDESASR